MRASGYVDLRNGITLGNVMESEMGQNSAAAPLVDVDRWTAGECREYLHYAGREYASAPAALVSRVRTRLASLQLAELWPVDPRD